VNLTKINEREWQNTREMYRQMFARGCIEREEFEEVMRDSADAILKYRAWGITTSHKKNCVNVDCEGCE
jgi:Ca2+-binding EF-hand superfamily protein